MLTKNEVIEITTEVLKKHNLDTKVVFLPYLEFQQKAQCSPVIQQALKEGTSLYDLNIPSLYSHQKNTVYLSMTILVKLLQDEPRSIQERFIKAIAYHELCHIRNKRDIMWRNFSSSLFSEEVASKEFERHYPGLAALGKRICKKYLKS